MAVIQMVNKEVIDVTETQEEVYGKVSRCSFNVPMIKLTAVDSTGEHPIYVNASQINSFIAAEDAGSASSTKDHPWR